MKRYFSTEEIKIANSERNECEGFAMFNSNRSSVLIPSLKLQQSDDLLQRVGRYFERHPEASREAFLRNAIARKLSDRTRRSGFALQTIGREEDVRNHAWLEERLATVRHERHGLLAKLRGLFLGAY